MNWIKENKSLAGVLGFMVIGAVGLGVVLFMAMADYGAAMEEWGNSNNKAATLKGQKIYPNQENVDKFGGLLNSYAEKVNLLRNALLLPAVQKPVTDIGETQFQAKLKERVAAVRKMADASGVKLPDGFSLGFDEYTNSVPKSPEAAAQLSLHLDVVEKLVTTLIEAGVVSIDSLQRPILPIEQGVPVEPVQKVAPKPAKANAKSGAGGKKPVITAEIAAKPVIDRFTIKLNFQADQGPFQSVINTISDPAKMPDFLVVRLLRVENTSQEGPLKAEVLARKQSTAAPLVPGEGAAAPTGVAVPPAAGAPASGGMAGSLIAPVAPLPKDAVTVMGDEKLLVYLEVDYARFRPVESADDTAAPVKGTAANTTR